MAVDYKALVRRAKIKNFLAHTLPTSIAYRFCVGHVMVKHKCKFCGVSQDFLDKCYYSKIRYWRKRLSIGRFQIYY